MLHYNRSECSLLGLLVTLRMFYYFYILFFEIDLNQHGSVTMTTESCKDAVTTFLWKHRTFDYI